jgi:serine/threonine protein kinase/tetratricopeptide (TPR) repeat protein
MIGKTISHYKILEKLGGGGMGIVYKAQDLKLDRFVALKFLPPFLSTSDEEKQRFIHEAKAASALQHHNICVIHEIDETEDDQMYIVMECYEGESLKEKIERSPLKVEEALNIAFQIAHGLEKAHAKKIVHRDIKPANILITEDGVVKIVDFGLAKLAGRTVLTKEGTTLGTVNYMSPEQTEGADVDHRADIWALGVMLYEMLTGERPFKGDYEQAVIYSILNEEPEPLQKHNPAIPEELDTIVHKTLAKKPSERYTSLKNFLKDLIAVTGDQKLSMIRSPGKNVFTKKRNYIFAGLVLILFLIGLNIGGIRNWILTGGFSGRHIRLAVLPFANLTGDPDQEYLCDGFTQEMISQLGQLHPENLSVIARSSIMRYKAGDIPIDQIGQELNVDYVLEGSTRRDRDEIRISADLIKVSDQSRLWGYTYERKFAGILKVQSEVAQNVAEALALNLLPAVKDRLTSVKIVNPEAYEAYVRGSYKWMNFITPGDLDTAEKYFDLALEKDPSYAPVYAGRAWVWIIRNQIGFVSPVEARPEAKAAALRAIELDENFAGAHEALASVRGFMYWDWDVAWESWRRSLELNPNSANAHGAYAQFLIMMGHCEEALIHSKRAVELDPFNPLIQCWHDVVLFYLRRYDEAIAAAQEALRIQPDYPFATNTLWYILHEKKGMERESFEAAKDFARVTYNDPRIETALDKGYAQGGYTEAMKRVAEALVARLPETYCLPSDIASFYTMAGEKDKALDWLQRGLEIHDPALPYLGLHCFDDIRPDPRFQELLRKMNLPSGNIN